MIQIRLPIQKYYSILVCTGAVLLFLWSCKNDDLPDTLFTPISGATPNNEIENVTGSLIGTWFLIKLFNEDGTERILSACDKKRKATYRSNGTCSHERYSISDKNCELTDAYSCRYSFELGIITSTSEANGTVKSIVEFYDINTLEVFNNQGDMIAVYSRAK